MDGTSCPAAAGNAVRPARPAPGHVVFLPDWRDNPYQSLLAEALARHGVGVRFADVPKGLLALNRLPRAIVSDADTVHLHWINDLVAPIVWCRNAFRRRVLLWLLALDVLLMRLRGRQVVWTIHNLVAHESPDPVAELAARKLLARCCSRLILHSAGALRAVELAYGFRLGPKAAVLPHGNYDGCYPADVGLQERLCRELSIEPDDTVLLMFGAIRAYKGIGTLVDAFKRTPGRHLKLVIAGNVHPARLQPEIDALCAGDNRIRTRFGFVGDDMVAPLLAIADAVVIPFERTLTSGSTILAMTHGKATILPDHARALDVVDERSTLFFDDPAGLARLLATLDRRRLREMGAHARRTADALNWHAIAAATAGLYGQRAVAPHSSSTA